MGRTIIKGICVFWFLAVCFICDSVPSQAAYYNSPYIVEQAKGQAPDVEAYITGDKVSSKAVYSGKIGNDIQLEQSGDSTVFKKSNEGIHYIVLLDNSGSVEPKQFNEVKRQLVKMRKDMNEKDKMTLYAVGTMSSSGNKKSVFDKTASGNKKNEVKQDITRIKKISIRRGAKSRTVLYRSLNDVLAKNTSVSMRTVVILITDGEDDSLGKNNSKESTLKNVQEAILPVYCVMLKNKSKKPNKEKMKYTFRIMEEKNSRGYCVDCSSSSSVKTVKKGFLRLHDIFMNKTYVVPLQASNNKPLDGIVKLQLTAKKGSRSEPVAVSSNVDYSGHEEDTEPPVIKDIKKSDKNAITFFLTDNSGSVVGADKASNYVIKEKSENNNDGRVWKVSNVNYNSVNNTVILTFEESLYTGSYILSCNNIYDDTQEKNPLNQSYEFTFEGLNAKSEKVKNILKSYWWALLIILVIIIGLIVIRIIKKRPEKIVEVNPDDLLKADSKMIRLTITDRTGAIKDVEWNVEGSLFVGRSDICNIFFDDERLSKQHFVIEVTKMACYIEDLESTNGTFVNGVKMTNRRMLLDGDIVTAGREKFVFHLVKDASVAEEEPEK